MVESLQIWLKTNNHLWDPVVSWFDNHFMEIVAILIGATIAYFIGGKLLARLVKRLVSGARHRGWHRKDIEKRQKTLSGVTKNVWHIIVVVITTIMIFREIVPNADALLTPLFASAGIIGVAVGFGAQSLIKDFLAGLFIIGENQYRVGDIVEIEGASGTVEKIGSRSTVLRDVSGNVHYIPNGSIIQVINKTMGYSVARFVIAVDPTSDIKKITDIINHIGQELADEAEWKNKIINPPAFVSVGEFTGTSVQIIISGKTQPSDQWSVTAEMRRRLLPALEKAKVKLAPQQLLVGSGRGDS